MDKSSAEKVPTNVVLKVLLAGFPEIVEVDY